MLHPHTDFEEPCKLSAMKNLVVDVLHPHTDLEERCQLNATKNPVVDSLLL